MGNPRNGDRESQGQDKQETRFGYTFPSVDWVVVLSIPKKNEAKTREVRGQKICDAREKR